MFSRFRLADITPGFLTMAARLRDEVSYVSPMKKKTLPALTVRRQFDPADDDGVGGYYFAERAGRDSVAFLLHDETRGDAAWGVLSQWHGPLRRFVTGAYTGSLDKPGLGLADIVQEEVVEEAGYRVGPERIDYLGAQPVSGKCKEECHLFRVDVAGLPMLPLRPENPFEANTERPWWTAQQVLEQGEWKSRLTLLAYIQSR